MIKITKKVYNKLLSMSAEECGVIYGRKEFNQIKKFNNKSKQNDEFIADKKEILVWLFEEKYSLYCFFHIHDKYRAISKKDYDNMLKDVLYLIVFLKFLFFYKKNDDGIIEMLDYIVVKDG